MGDILGRARGLVRTVALSAATAAGAVAVVARTTPWPSALVIRAVFDRGAARSSAALAGTSRATSSRSSTRHTTSPRPTGGSTSSGHLATSRCRRSSGCTAGPSCPDRRATSPTTSGCSPAVGSRRSVSTTRSPPARATRRPSSRWPPRSPTSSTTPTGSASTRRASSSPGDSAGAQIAAQVALLVTDAGYATEVGIEVAVPPSSLRVSCSSGAYDFRLARTSRLGSWLVESPRHLVIPRLRARRHDERTTRQGSVPAARLALVPADLRLGRKR